MIDTTIDIYYFLLPTEQEFKFLNLAFKALTALCPTYLQLQAHLSLCALAAQALGPPSALFLAQGHFTHYPPHFLLFQTLVSLFLPLQTHLGPSNLGHTPTSMKPFTIPLFGVKSPFTCPQDLVFEFMITLKRGRKKHGHGVERHRFLYDMLPLRFPGHEILVDYANSPFFSFLLRKTHADSGSALAGVGRLGDSNYRVPYAE